jgi:hypothetical protein
VQDPNQGGLQPVRAVLSQSDPTLGTLSTTNLALMTPAQLSLALQGITYTPTPGARPVGVIAESTLTLRAIDVSGLSASNTSVKVRITSVNGAPQILNLPAPADQPVLDCARRARPPLRRARAVQRRHQQGRLHRHPRQRRQGRPHQPRPASPRPRPAPIR